MLKEYLLSLHTHPVRWSGSMPGVQICRFSLREPVREALRPIPVCGEPLHFEALFCLRGRLAVRPRRGIPYAVEAPGIFLLSDSSGVSACLCSGDLGGILVAVDASSAKESLQAVCSPLGMKLDTRGVKEKMAAKSGCAALLGTPWTQALFETVGSLPEDAQERYCVFKSVELLYLLCSQTPASNGSDSGTGGHVPPGIPEVKAYIQAHLSEKITIDLLCRQFLVSPTFLKEGFRRAYGIPIHSWVMERRMQRARELICTTRMPVQKVAQAVGYEGMSQFHTLFKRYYGMTPGQYRKMSETAAPRLF